MKFLFDLIPLLLFFAAYKLSGWNAEAAQHFINTYLSGMISGGSVKPDESPIVIATLVGILATMAQIGYIKARGRKVDFVLWFSLAMFVFFGGLTIYLHDEDFIKWKLSIVYWFFASGLLVSELVFKKNLMRKSMEEIIQLPDLIWGRLNLAWICFFVAMGFLNWYVAFVLFKGDTSSWVSFKAFGSTAIMFVFIVGQTIYLSRHIKDEA
ncbi:septation protein A [Duganella sp. BJB488]|uniref:Inner membrane-spanning protein YciB n=1 Tax=Duganella vulcania TaxID=2692166 RepID=A0A845HC72_9BURK|nr:MULTISPECIES: septation protein A [Duganella]MYN15867.1 septation protein A [Duganella vulcania]NVD72474.1 septation protein A [Duganella sp. BJB1802]RFP11093.1 septation protein A [Duganella sp. BJB489]RFP14358.1 septation protein A [Duganella sp. BJB488]RFP30293.1 septation protein A [Duganella sp. BJB480]